MPGNFILRTEGGAVADSSEKLSQALNDWLTTFGPNMFKSCANCKHMVDNGPTFCTLWQQTPPVATVVAGCPSHEDKEEIPF